MSASVNELVRAVLRITESPEEYRKRVAELEAATAAHNAARDEAAAKLRALADAELQAEPLRKDLADREASNAAMRDALELQRQEADRVSSEARRAMSEATAARKFVDAAHVELDARTGRVAEGEAALADRETQLKAGEDALAAKQREIAQFAAGIRAEG